MMRGTSGARALFRTLFPLVLGVVADTVTVAGCGKTSGAGGSPSPSDARSGGGSGDDSEPGADGKGACFGSEFIGNGIHGGVSAGAHSTLVAQGSPLPEVRGSAAGVIHGCALTAQGVVARFGNTRDALGATVPGEGHIYAGAKAVTAGAVAIASGFDSTCALVAQGTGAGEVRCWGVNGSGEVGDGSTSKRATAFTVPLAGQSAGSISMGKSNACASLSSGGVRCWGSNETGQLGDRSKSQRTAPSTSRAWRAKPSRSPRATCAPAPSSRTARCGAGAGTCKAPAAGRSAWDAPSWNPSRR